MHRPPELSETPRQPLRAAGRSSWWVRGVLLALLVAWLLVPVPAPGQGDDPSASATEPAGDPAAIDAVADPADAAADRALSEEPSRRLGDGAPALVIERGSVAYRQVVGVGRDVVVAGEARSDVATMDGSVRITGRVDGDVIVFSGDVRLGPRAGVGGDVFVLGGSVLSAPGARIDGRTVSYPTASAAWLTLLEGPSLGLEATEPLVLGGKLALLAAWMALVLVLFASSGREMLATSEVVTRETGRCFLSGLVGVVALVLTAVLFSALAPPLVGAPLLVLLVLLGLLLKLWGMVAVFHALGAWVSARLGRPRLLALNAATVGLVLLGVFKFVPLVGSWVWMVATLVGVGAALTSKFGRREAWFDLAQLERPVSMPR